MIYLQLHMCAQWWSLLKGAYVVEWHQQFPPIGVQGDVGFGRLLVAFHQISNLVQIVPSDHYNALTTSFWDGSLEITFSNI